MSVGEDSITTWSGCSTEVFVITNIAFSWWQ
jgi:hypothetical protein